MKKTFCLSLSLFCSIIFFGQENISKSPQNKNDISNYINLTQQQLLDTAKYYFNLNKFDTALICYNLIIKTPIKYIDILVYTKKGFRGVRQNSINS